jgi:hypothetical protein
MKAIIVTTNTHFVDIDTISQLLSFKCVRFIDRKGVDPCDLYIALVRMRILSGEPNTSVITSEMFSIAPRIEGRAI